MKVQCICGLALTLGSSWSPRFIIHKSLLPLFFWTHTCMEKENQLKWCRMNNNITSTPKLWHFTLVHRSSSHPAESFTYTRDFTLFFSFFAVAAVGDVAPLASLTVLVSTRPWAASLTNSVLDSSEWAATESFSLTRESRSTIAGPLVTAGGLEARGWVLLSQHKLRQESQFVF